MIGGIRLQVVSDASARSLLGFVREMGRAGHYAAYRRLAHATPNRRAYPHEPTVLPERKLAGRLLQNVRRARSLLKR